MAPRRIRADQHHEVGEFEVFVAARHHVLAEGALLRDGLKVVLAGQPQVRREDAAKVLEKAQAREANETAKRARLAAGELGLDIYNMRDALKAKGLVYEDYQE